MTYLWRVVFTHDGNNRTIRGKNTFLKKENNKKVNQENKGNIRKKIHQ